MTPLLVPSARIFAEAFMHEALSPLRMLPTSPPRRSYLSCGSCSCEGDVALPAPGPPPGPACWSDIEARHDLYIAGAIPGAAARGVTRKRGRARGCCTAGARAGSLRARCGDLGWRGGGGALVFAGGAAKGRRRSETGRSKTASRKLCHAPTSSPQPPASERSYSRG
jgi:hypothetical protein